jgi:vacuolar protein sorting-associated protein 45
VQQLIKSEGIPRESKVRLAILYALRYQKFAGNAIGDILSLLAANGLEHDAAVR